MVHIYEADMADLLVNHLIQVTGMLYVLDILIFLLGKKVTKRGEG